MQPGSPVYLVPAAEVRIEHIVSKSRFICHLGPGPSPARIHAALNRLRVQHPRADHLCWAFIAGTPAAAERAMSDDGEPKGTAGRPMLQVLEHSGFTEIWVAVVRYFGGIKLGTGGLVRAYTSSVKQALELVEPIRKEARLQYRLYLDYNLLPLFERDCRIRNVEILLKSFGAQAEVTVSVPEAAVDEFSQDLSRVSGGTAVLKSV